MYSYPRGCGRIWYCALGAKVLWLQVLCWGVGGWYRVKRVLNKGESRMEGVACGLRWWMSSLEQAKAKGGESQREE